MTESKNPRLSEEQIKYMVNRFLGWRLPENFNPDAGISFQPNFNEETAHPMRHEPTGTNLFDATQAEEMVRYLVDGMTLEATPTPEELCADCRHPKSDSRFHLEAPGDNWGAALHHFVPAPASQPVSAPVSDPSVHVTGSCSCLCGYRVSPTGLRTDIVCQCCDRHTCLVHYPNRREAAETKEWVTAGDLCVQIHLKLTASSQSKHFGWLVGALELAEVRAALKESEWWCRNLHRQWDRDYSNVCRPSCMWCKRFSELKAREAELLARGGIKDGDVPRV